MNKIVKLAVNSGMEAEEFEACIIECAQAVLPMMLKNNGAQSVRLETTQLGKEYELTFKLINKE